MNPDSKIRLFLALELPLGLREELERLQARLKKNISGEIKWVRTEGIHLTLKFFGDVLVNRLKEISGPLGQAAADFVPFSLCARGLGAFPNIERPRVIWVGLEGSLNSLAGLQTKIDAAMAALGFPAEKRPFTPHLTLARVKTPETLKGLSKMLEAHRTCQMGQFIATELSLIKSDLKPHGAVYTTLASFPLGGVKPL